MKPERNTFALRRNVLPGLLLAGLFILAAVAGSAQQGPSVGTPKPGHVLSSLTEDERQWLRDHPVITLVHDPGWPPIEFSDERGEITGMAGDYVKLVEQRLGFSFSRIPHLTWQEGYARLKRWEIDMATCVAKTPNRSEFWAFTKPYLTVPIVIATQSDVTYIADVKELFGKKVALVEGYAIDDWITKDFPEINLIRVKEPQEGLALLQRGEVFAYIDNLLIIGDYQAKMKVTNIKIAGQTPYSNAQRMAVRKDWEPLAGILDKALDSISETERKAIFGKWLPLRYEHGFDYTFLWWALSFFAVVFLALVLWNWRLAREIKNRKKAEVALRESERRFRDLYENLRDGMAVVDERGRIVHSNPQFLRMLGYALEEATELTYEDITPSRWHDMESRILREQVDVRGYSDLYEKEYIHKSGTVIPVEIQTYLAGKNNGKTNSYWAFVRDITESKKSKEALEGAFHRLDQIIEFLPDSTVVIDDKGVVEAWNRAMEELTG